jgi:hypothetical protein
MSESTTAIQMLTAVELGQAKKGSWYTIYGAGGDLNEWVDGYQRYFTERNVGTPKAWFQTTGREVNAYASEVKHGKIRHSDTFQDDLEILLVPLEGLNVGALIPLRLALGDCWFDDIIQNMRLVP